MNDLLNNNRWLVWTIVVVIAVAFFTLGYIEFQKGEIEGATIEAGQ